MLKLRDVTENRLFKNGNRYKKKRDKCFRFSFILCFYPTRKKNMNLWGAKFNYIKEGNPLYLAWRCMAGAWNNAPWKLWWRKFTLQKSQKNWTKRKKIESKSKLFSIFTNEFLVEISLLKALWERLKSTPPKRFRIYIRGPCFISKKSIFKKESLNLFLSPSHRAKSFIEGFL